MPHVFTRVRVQLVDVIRAVEKKYGHPIAILGLSP